MSTHLSYVLSQQQTRRNLKALLKYVFFLVIVVLAYALVFHWIMETIENEDHSWITGVYWTLTVMSTLGFGDITFHSDVGRAFSILVLLSRIVLLLIVLPFAFIRFFYSPWLDAQIRLRAPRWVPADTAGHVIICRYETVARGLVKKLKSFNIPYYVLEQDTTVAANLHEEGISVVTGEIDNITTYAALRSSKARMVLANANDATNTNITLTVRRRLERSRLSPLLKAWIPRTFSNWPVRRTFCLLSKNSESILPIVSRRSMPTCMWSVLSRACLSPSFLCRTPHGRGAESGISICAREPGSTW